MIHESDVSIKDSSTDVKSTRLPEEMTINTSGSGFVIADGLVAANYHVIDTASRISVRTETREYAAKMMIHDPANDLALLAVSELVNMALHMGNVLSVREGSTVYTMGFPLSDILGARVRIGQGIVNSAVGMANDPRMFQISIPVQPGNSGGPLIDESGNVIGIVTSTLDNRYLLISRDTIAQNVNFAMKINYVHNLLGLVPGDHVLNSERRSGDAGAAAIRDEVGMSVVQVLSWR